MCLLLTIRCCRACRTEAQVTMVHTSAYVRRLLRGAGQTRDLQLPEWLLSWQLPYATLFHWTPKQHLQCKMPCRGCGQEPGLETPQ